MSKRIAICLNCYYNSDISKLILQLTSLLCINNNININNDDNNNNNNNNNINNNNNVKNNNNNNVNIKNNNINNDTNTTIVNLFNKIYSEENNFTNIDECINYLKQHGFKQINKYPPIHIALYCDGLSGYVYKDINDFKKRIDIKEFEEIFKDTVFNASQLKSVPYFIYKSSPLSFPQINEQIKKEIMNINITDIKSKILSFQQKYNIIPPKYIFNYVNFDFQKPDFIIYNYVYNKYFKSYDFSKEISKIYNCNFKLTYSSFIELYQLQPELFNDKIKKYFKNFKNNYSKNVDKIKKIFNEFHNKYPNSSLQGTRYHTNLMINRTRFLNDFDEYYKFFIDDDDFTGGLNNYYSIYKWYIENVHINYNEINKILQFLNIKSINHVHYNFDEKNRKIIKHIIENNIDKPLGRYLYVVFMKYCIYKFNVWNQNKIQNQICAIWNDIIPPYLPLNFLNIQETRCEDSSFNYFHFVNKLINNDFIVYYYHNPSLQNYTQQQDYITELKIKSIFSYFNISNLNYLGLNYGRWFYKLNDNIEFINSKQNTKNIKI